MGKHSGSHSAPRAGRAPATHGASGASSLLLTAGVSVTLVAWGFLVLAAIDFGREARSGEPTAWWFLLLATVGAAACLFVALLLGARLMAVLRPATPTEGAQGASAASTDPAPAAAPPGRRRAAR